VCLTRLLSASTRIVKYSELSCNDLRRVTLASSVEESRCDIAPEILPGLNIDGAKKFELGSTLADSPRMAFSWSLRLFWRSHCPAAFRLSLDQRHLVDFALRDSADADSDSGFAGSEPADLDFAVSQALHLH